MVPMDLGLENVRIKRGSENESNVPACKTPADLTCTGQYYDRGLHSDGYR